MRYSFVWLVSVCYDAMVELTAACRHATSFNRGWQRAIIDDMLESMHSIEMKRIRLEAPDGTSIVGKIGASVRLQISNDDRIKSIDASHVGYLVEEVRPTVGDSPEQAFAGLRLAKPSAPTVLVTTGLFDL